VGHEKTHGSPKESKRGKSDLQMNRTDKRAKESNIEWQRIAREYNEVNE